MKELTKGQKDYRRRKKEGEDDLKHMTREDGKTITRIANRQLCVRINEDSASRLKQEANIRGLTQGDMLTWMLIHGIPKYSTGSVDKNHNWPSYLLNPQERTVKYKAASGSNQINLAISSTAWNKLECHKTATGLSKARIVQTLILNYKFLSQRQLDKQREYRATSDERLELQYIEMQKNYKKQTPEELEKFWKRFDEMAEERQESLDNMFDSIKENVVNRLLSESDETPYVD